MGQGETPRTEEAWVSHLLQGEVVDGVLTGRGQGRGLLGRRRRGGHKSGLCTPASPFPVKEAVAKGVAEGRVGQGQWDPRGEARKPTRASEKPGCLAGTEPQTCHRASWLRSRAFSSLGVGVEKVTRHQALGWDG